MLSTSSVQPSGLSVDDTTTPKQQGVIRGTNGVQFVAPSIRDDDFYQLKLGGGGWVVFHVFTVIFVPKFAVVNKLVHNTNAPL